MHVPPVGIAELVTSAGEEVSAATQRAEFSYGLEGIDGAAQYRHHFAQQPPFRTRVLGLSGVARVQREKHVRLQKERLASQPHGAASAQLRRRLFHQLQRRCEVLHVEFDPCNAHNGFCPVVQQSRVFRDRKATEARTERPDRVVRDKMCIREAQQVAAKVPGRPHPRTRLDGLARGFTRWQQLAVVEPDGVAGEAEPLRCRDGCAVGRCAQRTNCLEEDGGGRRTLAGADERLHELRTDDVCPKMARVRKLLRNIAQQGLRIDD
mmetsp:Transcript_5583/g.13952  ORF Transcript_5583/g.13952 Transcript_5583/m.13952 type:complete len:265 (-) Transcript_5583:1560-2354(-)